MPKGKGAEDKIKWYTNRTDEHLKSFLMMYILIIILIVIVSLIFIRLLEWYIILLFFIFLIVLTAGAFLSNLSYWPKKVGLDDKYVYWSSKVHDVSKCELKKIDKIVSTSRFKKDYFRMYFTHEGHYDFINITKDIKDKIEKIR